MNKQELKKKTYTAAQCTIVNVEAENFFCASVTPGGNDPDFDDKGDFDGGDMPIGDANGGAPSPTAAKRGELYEDDFEF